MSRLEQVRALLASLETSEALAEQFCELDDDAQAQFFVHVARIMDGWGGVARLMQVSYIGNHLRTCACSTPEAREWVLSLAEHLSEVLP